MNCERWTLESIKVTIRIFSENFPKIDHFDYNAKNIDLYEMDFSNNDSCRVKSFESIILYCFKSFDYYHYNGKQQWQQVNEMDK